MEDSRPAFEKDLDPNDLHACDCKHEFALSKGFTRAELAYDIIEKNFEGVYETIFSYRV